MKKCYICGVIKPYDDFCIDNSKKDGRFIYCRPCDAVYRKQKYDKYYGKIKNARRKGKRSGEYKKLSLFETAKKRASERNLPFNLEAKDIIIPKYCPILGVELKINTEYVRDNSPTLDRLIPEKGYTKGNVNVISHKANRIKNNGTLEELKLLISWMEKQNPGQNNGPGL